MRARLPATRLFIGVLAASLAVACTPPSTSDSADAPAADDSSVVARLDGSDITTTRLDEYIKDQLLDQATRGDSGRLHELRRESLDNLIDETVVEQEAEKLGVGVDEYIQAEATKLISVTDADVSSFFESNQEQLGGQTLEQMAPRIRQHLERQAGAEAARKVIADVRDKHEVEVLLETPRFEVAAVGAARGPEDAPVTIVEFSDYQCPFCSRAEPIIAQVLERYPGKVRFVYRHFPLDSIHPLARAASEAAACAGDQGKFWEFHERIFANQSALTAEDLKGLATELELDLAAYDGCVADRTHRQAIEEDLAAGRAVGVTGTPAFFVNGIPLKGAQPVEAFSKIIDEELGADG